MDAVFLMPLMVIYFAMITLQLSDLRHLIRRLSSSQKSSSNRGLPYPGLSYPDTGVDFVDLELHRLNLLKWQSDTEAWLAEHPSPDPPELSRLDKVMLWLNSNSRTIFVAACVSLAMTILALVLEGAWPHVDSFFDNPYGQPFFDEDPPAEAPSFIKDFGFWVMFPVAPLFVLAMISMHGSTAGSRAHQDYDRQVDLVGGYRTKLDAINSQLKVVNQIRPLMHQLLRG